MTVARDSLISDNQPNQVSTMRSLTAPANPLPPGAAAISSVLGRNRIAPGAQTGTNLPPGSVQGGVPPGPPQTMDATPEGDSGPYGAIGGVGGSATPSADWQAAHDYYATWKPGMPAYGGPTTQTASGGVTTPGALTNPSDWNNFYRSYYGSGTGRARGASVPPTARVMVPQRTTYGG